jgi:hypothetical protein
MGERRLRNHVESVLNNAAMRLDSDQFMLDWERFFELEGNQYLIPALRSSSQETRSAIHDNFVSLNFFVRGTRPRIYLRPNLNLDLDGTGSHEEMVALDQYITEMLRLGHQLLTRYTTYRRVVKEHLFL